MAAHYSSHYLDRLWQFLFDLEESGGEGAAELKHQHQQELDANPQQQKAHGSAAVDGSAAGDTAVAAVDPPSRSSSVVGFERTVGGAPVCA